jgi:hypothetical protein
MKKTKMLNKRELGEVTQSFSVPQDVYVFEQGEEVYVGLSTELDTWLENKRRRPHVKLIERGEKSVVLTELQGKELTNILNGFDPIDYHLWIADQTEKAREIAHKKGELVDYGELAHYSGVRVSPPPNPDLQRDEGHYGGKYGVYREE